MSIDKEKSRFPFSGTAFSFFSVKREMPILFFVNCERTVLFSVKRDLDPPFTTLYVVMMLGHHIDRFLVTSHN